MRSIYEKAPLNYRTQPEVHLYFYRNLYWIFHICGYVHVILDLAIFIDNFIYNDSSILKIKIYIQ